MKKVFSLLLAFVFLQAETWAIGGGPSGGGGGGALIGTYAGVLIPVSQTKAQVVNQTNSASIGLFVIGVPATGVATGSAVAFVNGIAFLGDVTGIADPAKQTLVGIVEGQSNVSVITLVPVIDVNGLVTFQQVTTKIFAQGGIKARFDAGGGNVDPTTGTTGANRRISGTASLDLFLVVNSDGSPDIANTVKFRVDGFQQSATASTVTIDFGGGTGTTP